MKKEIDKKILLRYKKKIEQMALYETRYDDFFVKKSDLLNDILADNVYDIRAALLFYF